MGLKAIFVRDLILPFRKQKISQVGFARLAVMRLEAPGVNFILLCKTSFQESEHDDDSFRKNFHITSWFSGRQGNSTAEMSASLIAST